MRALRRALAVAALALVCSSVGSARADDEVDRALADLYWGGGPLLPISVLTVSQPNGALIDVVPPGGGVAMRIGFELGGFGLELAGGMRAHGVQNGAPLIMAGGGLGLRWAIDVGGPVRPLVMAHGYLWIVTHEGGSGPTFAADAGGGVEIELASWIALEVTVLAEVVAPAEILSDAALFVTPAVGLVLRY